MIKALRSLSIVALALFGAAGSANAQAIVGGSSLLTEADVVRLEQTLGEGPLTLTKVFSRTPGDGKTSTSFHQAVDGRGRTFSVLEVLPAAPARTATNIVVGYNPRSWNGQLYNYVSTPAIQDRTAFLSNLTTGTVQRQRTTYNDPGYYQTYNTMGYGPTFGGGHDLWVDSTLSGGHGYARDYGPDNTFGRENSIVIQSQSRYYQNYYWDSYCQCWRGGYYYYAYDSLRYGKVEVFTISLRQTKAPATLTLSNLLHTYDSSAKGATVTTSPAGLSGVQVTYTQNGQPVIAPTTAGSYGVVASLSSDTHEASSVSGILSISKAPASLTLSGLSHTYDGAAKGALVSTNPSGLSGVSLSYSRNGMPVSAPTAAGTYAVTATLANSNYEATAAADTLTIRKADPAISVTDSPAGALPFGTAFTVSATSTSGGAVMINGSGGCSGGPSAGTVALSMTSGSSPCQVTAAVAESDNYNAATHSFTVAAAKRAATISLSSLSHTFDGSAKSASATTAPAGLSTITITYMKDGSVVSSVTEAGSYGVLASLANDDYAAPDATGTLLITKAPQSITFSPLSGRTYGDTPFGLGATATSGLAVSYSAAGGCSVAGTLVTITGAGSCTITASQAGNGNYDPATSVEQSFTIAKAVATLSLSNLAHTYDGSAKTASTSTNPSGLAAVTVAYSQGGQPVASPVNAGSYDVVASLTNNNYSASNAVGTLVIAKAAQTISFGALAGRTYGDAPFGVSASSTSWLEVSFAATGGCSVSGTLVTITSAGPCTITASQTGGDNYNAAAPVSQSFSVAKATPVVTWSNPVGIVYGTALSGTQLNATASVGGAFNYSPAAGTLLGAGSGQTLNAVFTPTDTANYNSVPASVVINVAKATATVSVTGGTWTYDATTHPASGAVAGVMIGGVAENLGSPTFSYNGMASVPLNAGTYAVVGSFAGNVNYEPASGSGASIVISKATPTVLVTGGTFGYDAQPHPATGSVIGVGGASVGTPTFTYNGAVEAPLNAGTYDVIALVAESANYLAASGNAQIIINKARPAIVVNSGTYTYDAVQHPASGSATGVGGAVLAALTYTYNAAADVPVNAGSYAVIGSYAGSQNYEAGSGTATITINKAPQSISWSNPVAIVYGTRLGGTQLNAAVAGVNGGTEPGALSYTPAAGTMLDAGSQTLSVAAGGTDNYLPATLSVSLVVNKADQAITWSAPAGIVYGAALGVSQLNASVAGVTGGSAPGALTYSPIAGTVLNAGSGQTLSVAAAGTSNYNPASASTTINVAKAPLTVVADNKSKLYGQLVPTLTGTVSGVVNNDGITATYSTAATQSSNVDGYPITASLVDPGTRLANYNVTITNGTLTISKAPLNVSVNASTKQYSDPLPAFSVSYSGFVLGEIPGVLGGSLVYATSADRFSGPGTYTVTASGLTSGNYAISWTAGRLTVTLEDARATYIGALFASTSSPSTNQAVVTLAATVRDITAVVGDAAYDTFEGDVRKATVTFLNRDMPCSTISIDCVAGFKVIASNLVVGLVNTGDTKTGTATTNWIVDIGSSDSEDFTVGVVVDGYYTTGASQEVSIVTVSRPLNDFITGGGYVVLAQSAGIKSGNVGSKNNFGFNVKYNKSGKTLQGRINTIVRRTEADGIVHLYQIKGNAMTSLTTNPNTGVAIFNGKANITDITNPLAPVSLGGNATLQVNMTDRGEPGNTDSIGITLWNSDGGVWFSSKWDGTRTQETTLGGGNLQVK